MTQPSPFKRYFLDISIQKKQKISKKICANKHVLYSLLNYDKNHLTYNNWEAAMYRSVVFSFPEKKPLCFSPPRSSCFDLFKVDHPDVSSDSLFANEVVEGVMINLFFDPRMGKWEIATKSGIGGQYWFYSIKTVSTKKTFYQMFLEALCAAPNQELNQLPFLDYFPKWATFSFVLQHPENPRLLPVEKPQLYLVAMYRIQEEMVEWIPPDVCESMSIFHNINGVISFPKRIPLSSYEEYPYSAKAGVMLFNLDTGERAHWKNPIYESIHRMKRIEPFPQYLYFSVRRFLHTAQQPTFLNGWIDQYPTYRKQLRNIDEEFRAFVKAVYHAYLYLFIYKNHSMTHLEKHAMHARRIHLTVFLPQIRRDRKQKRTSTFYISKREVEAYFNRMEPREVMYLMNEDRRNEGDLPWTTNG